MINKFKYPALIVLGFSISVISYSQNWDCSVSSTYVDKTLLKLNLNGGIASYFGDLSIYDQNPGEKTIYESRPSFGVIGTVQITKSVGISGQILMADLQASMKDITFETEIFEYNLHGRVNLINLFLQEHDPKYGLEAYAGIGQFFYTVTKYNEASLLADKTVYPPRVPEFVYFFGGGFFYKFNKYLSFTADLALRQCQTDKLDAYVPNDDYDYYSYLSIGLTIDIGRLINPKPKTRYQLK